jgi:hypothetical protein
MTIFQFVIVREAHELAKRINAEGAHAVLAEIHRTHHGREALLALLAAQRIADENFEMGNYTAISAINRAIENLRRAGVSAEPIKARRPIHAVNGPRHPRITQPTRTLDPHPDPDLPSEIFTRLFRAPKECL